MGWLSKFIPKEIKKPVNKLIGGVSKISDKLIPNELRFLAPYAAGIGTLMLPPGMGPLMRGLAGAGFNTLGQIGADETPIEDIDDLNLLSVALSGGLGALGSDKVSGAMRGGIERPMAAGPQEYLQEAARNQSDIGFLQGAENVGREGIASLSDMVTGGRESLIKLGKNPSTLFTKTGATEAAKALGPTFSQGTGDVAYETAIDLQNQFDLDQAREMEEAGLGLDRIQSARAAAIRAGLEDNNYSEEEIAVIFERLGLTDWLDVAAAPPYEESAANGGIIGLRNGGMLNFGGREMDLRTGGFVPIGRQERADDVPARLSKNEFVMTADAVRAAGGGSVNKGAQRMYDIMNKLEARA